jgi:hypothetical protein
MQYVGFALIVIALIAGVAGLLQFLKGKKLLAAPFRKTGEVASNPQSGDAKGLVSVEGDVRAAQPLTSPVTNTPCVYFEHKIEHEVEESTLTEQGTKTSKKWKTHHDEKKGSIFQVDDGSGPIQVNVTDGVDADLKQMHSGPPPGHGVAGAAVAMITGALRVRHTEKILPAQGKLFVMGKLGGGQIAKQDGMLGKILLSTKGRDGLLGATKRNSLIGFIAGGVCILGGIPLAVFAEPPDIKSDLCPDSVRGAQKSCKGHIKDDAGQTLTWVVEQGGEYTILAKQPNVKYPIWVQLTLSDDSGHAMAQDKGIGKGADAKVTAQLMKGTYKINVHDVVPGYAAPFAKGGGLSYWIEISGPTAAAAPSASASAASLPTTSAAPSASAPAPKPGAKKK